jgi:hypothetical protein
VKLKFKPNVSSTGQQVCHKQIRDVAMAAAGELYGSMMSNNEFFATWKKQNPGCNAKQLERRFIERNWPRCIEFARQTLTILLTREDVAQEVKDQIMEVLEQDFALRNKQVSNTPFH